MTLSSRFDLFNRLILETDPPTIASRVSMRGADSDIPLTDRVTEVRLCTVTQGWYFICRHALSKGGSADTLLLMQVNIQSFLATAKEQLARSLLK